MNDFDFQLPKDWSACPIADLQTTVQSGQTPSRRNRSNFGGEIPWVKTLDLKECELTSTVESLSELGFKAIGSRLRPPKTVMVAMYGGKGTIGKSGILGVSAATNQAVCCIEPNESVFDAQFLQFFLISFRKEWMKFAIGTRKDPNISKTVVERTRIPLPPLPEQNKIAYILSAVQRAIEAQERIIQTTTELKKALMQKLFTEGLRNEPQKQTEIGPVPESWEVMEIGDLGQCVTGSTPKTKVAAFYDPPSEDFIAPADLGARRYVYESEKKISPKGISTIRPIPKNAVMCVCIGSSIGKVGMSFQDKSATNQQINSIVCKEGRDSEFVYYLLSYHWEYWKSFATFGPVPILSKGRFTSIVVAIPSSIEEQQAIAKPLVVLDAKVEVAEKKVSALQNLFRTLLHELMTAKIRINELEITE